MVRNHKSSRYRKSAKFAEGKKYCGFCGRYADFVAPQYEVGANFDQVSLNKIRRIW
jgi:hypothetical protein